MKFWIKNIFILLFGLGSCGSSYYVAKSSIHKVIHWERRPAIVSVYGSKTGRDLASFEYNGHRYSFKPMNASTRFGTAIFPKEDPAKAELLNYKSFLMIPLILAVLGLILIVIGFFSMQNKIAGKKVPPPSYDRNAHFQTLQDFATKQDEKRRNE